MNVNETGGRIRMYDNSRVHGNTANGDGGGIFIGANISASEAVRIRNNASITGNTAGGNGGGIHIRAALSNARAVSIDGNIRIHGNTAGGNGGGIHVNSNLAANPALDIQNGVRITGNTATDGGGIWVNLDPTAASPGTAARANGNLPPHQATTRIRINAGVVFEYNIARNGARIDENLGFRNPTFPSEGSIRWFGVNPSPLQAEWRTHLFNNHDINVRRWIEARTITFETIGTAGDVSSMVAEIHTTRHANINFATNNAAANNLGVIPEGSTTPVPVNPPMEIRSGDFVLRSSILDFEVDDHPWNASIIRWYSTIPIDNTTTINSTEEILPNRTISVDTHIQSRIEYRYHNIIFNAFPSTADTGGTVDGEASITRNLRESRDAEAHEGYTGETPRGAPIGLPPVPEARDGWGFRHWTHNDVVMTPEAIAAMYVTGPLTFVAVFELRVPDTIRLEPPSITVGNLQYGDFTAIVIDQFGDPLPNQENFVINWSSENTANVTVSPTSNAAGQVNTTRATAALTAPEGANTITARLSGTDISANGIVNITRREVPHSISVTPDAPSVFRGGNVPLTAVVLNQFGDPMPDQDSFVINWASATPANVTVSPASNAAGEANTTTATATSAAAMGSNNNVTATLDGTTISGTAVVTILVTHELEIEYRAASTPTGMTVTVDGYEIAANTGASVGTHNVEAEDAVELYAGAATNQTFLGWMTLAELEALPTNTGDNQYIPGFTGPISRTHNFDMPGDDKHLIAVWGNQHGEVSQLNDVQVTFDLNFGRVGTDNYGPITEVVIVDTEIGIARVPVPVRPGWTLTGWDQTVPTGGGTGLQRADVGEITVNEARTFVAQWERNEQVLTFNPNEGEWPGLSDAAATANQTRTINRGAPGDLYAQAFDADDNLVYDPQDHPTRDGWTFTGWFTDPTAGTRVLSTDTVTVGGTQTLFAQWTRDEQVLTFNPNLGTWQWPAPANNTDNQVRTINRGAPGDRYDQAFDGNGDLVGTPPTNPLIQFRPARADIVPGDAWVFQGWFTEAVGGVRVLSTDPVTAADEETLFAQFERRADEDDPVVRFWRNHTSPDVLHHLVTVRSGDTVVPPITPTRNGFVFIGWSTVADDADLDDEFDFETAITVSRDLYAQWEAYTGAEENDYVRVVFLWNTTETDETEYRNVRIAQGTTVGPFADPMRANYIFVGWSLVRDDPDEEQPFEFEDGVTASETRVYAQWYAPRVTVIFDGNGGTPVEQEYDAHIGGTYASAMAAIDEPTRPGHVFQGWFTDPVGGERVLPSNVVQHPGEGEHILRRYAQWERSASDTDPVVRFWRNHTTPDVLHHLVTVYSGDTVVPPITPTRDGYVFIGWFPVPAGDNDTWSFDFSTEITEDTDLYAWWGEYTGAEENDYVRVDFLWNRNDSDTALYRQVNIAYGTTAGLFANPTRDGYEFLGWSRERDDLELDHEFDFSVAMRDDETSVYAQWRAIPVDPVEVTVTFDPTAGAFAGVPGEPLQTRLVVEGARYETALNLHDHLLNPTLLRPVHPSGYVFAGWFTAEGARVVNTTVVPPGEGNHTLFAHWLPPVPEDNSWEVEFLWNHANEPGELYGQVTVEDGDTVNRPLDPRLADYVFMGWYEDAAGTIPFDFSTAIDSDLRLYARWEAIPGEPGDEYAPVRFYWNRTVEYELYHQESVVVGRPVGEPARPMRDGYEFLGWSRERDDLALAHRWLFSTLITPDGATLYAQWRAILPPTISLAFLGNGGQPAFQSLPVPAGTTYAEAIAQVTQPVREGHTFLYWSLSEEGGPVDGDRLVDPAYRMLFAQWEADEEPGPDPEIWMSFIGNGGTPAYRVIEIESTTTYGEAIAQWEYETGLREPSRANHRFLGWSLDEAGDEMVTSELEDQVIPADGRVLYAQWEVIIIVVPDPIVVTFVGNGGQPGFKTVTLEAETTTYGAVIGLWRTATELQEPTRAGYTFLGWSRVSTADGAIVPPAGEIDSDIVLFAQWERNPVTPDLTVIFALHGGNIAGSTVNPTRIVEPGGTLTDIPANPVRTGYTFGGWSMTPGGAPVENLGQLPITESKVLHALWSARLYTVTYDLQGGDIDGETVNPTERVQYGQTLANIPTGVGRENYTFLGWSATEDGEVIESLEDKTIYGDTTLYAIWTALPTVTVTFLRNAGEADEANVHHVATVIYGVTVAVPAIPVREGHVFLGWYLDADGAEAFDFTTPITEALTLYAAWALGVEVLFLWNYYGAANYGIFYESGVTLGETLAQPTDGDPVRAGYTFEGWYLDPEGAAAKDFDEYVVEELLCDAGTLRIYARWEREMWNPIHHAYLIGDQHGQIRPLAPATRAEVATIFFRLYSDEFRYANWLQTNPFPDVSNNGGQWFSNAISTTTNAGTFRGRDDGTFAPHDAMDRAEFAAVIARAFGLDLEAHTGPDLFTDISDNWARRYINAVGAAGWMVGPYGIDNVFNPMQTLQRAEVATTINRALHRQPEHVSDLLPGMRLWPDNADISQWYFLAIQEATNSHAHGMKECGDYEYWIELLPARRWAVLELPTSRPEHIIEADLAQRAQ